MDRFLKRESRLEHDAGVEANIEKYLVQIFENIQRAEFVKPCSDFLKSNPTIWDIAHIPCVLTVLCEIWQQHIDKTPSLQSITLSNLYELILMYTMRDYLVNSKAFIQVEVDRLKDSEVLEHCKTNLSMLGLLAKKLYAEAYAKVPDDITPSFNHTTFQAFFMAWHLRERLLEGGDRAEESFQFILNNKYVPQYRMVYGFLSGLLHRPHIQSMSYSKRKLKLSIETFWVAIDRPPRDFIGLSHVELLMCLMQEAQLDARIPQKNEKQASIKTWVWRYVLHRKRYKGHEYYDFERSVGERLMTMLVCMPKLVEICDLIPGLIQSLRDRTTWARGDAAFALGRLSPVLGEHVEAVTFALIEALNDTHWRVRSAVADALGELSDVLEDCVEEVVSALISALTDKYILIRISARKALEGFNIITFDKPEQVHLSLVERAGNTNSFRGDNAKCVILFLIRAMADKHYPVRNRAERVLAEHGLQGYSDSVIRICIRSLKDANWRVRSGAVKVLGHLGSLLGEHVEEVIPALMNAACDEEEFVRCYSIEVLGKPSKGINIQPLQRIPVCTQAVVDNSPWVRSSAVEALAELVIVSPDCAGYIMPHFMSTFEDIEPMVRESAVLAAKQLCMNINDSVECIVTALLGALSDLKSERVRSSSAEVLGELGAVISDELKYAVILALVQALDDESVWVRSSSIHALKQLGLTELFSTFFKHATHSFANSVAKACLASTPEKMVYPAIAFLPRQLIFVDNDHQCVSYRQEQYAKSRLMLLDAFSKQAAKQKMPAANLDSF